MRDVLGVDTTAIAASAKEGSAKNGLGVAAAAEEGALSVAETMELERRLKKTAQRGVVKLFNAVRAAQVRAEEAEGKAKRGGVVGIDERERRGKVACLRLERVLEVQCSVYTASFAGIVASIILMEWNDRLTWKTGALLEYRLMMAVMTSELKTLHYLHE